MALELFTERNFSKMVKSEKSVGYHKKLGLVSDSKNGVGPDSRTSRSDSPTLSDEGNFYDELSKSR